jgi:hypothetical protein
LDFLQHVGDGDLLEFSPMHWTRWDGAADYIASLTSASSFHDSFSTFRAAMAHFSGLKTEKSGRSLWPPFCVPPVTKADTWATTVLFDENYACGFQRPTNRKFIGSC